MSDKNELESKLSEHFCQKNSLPSQESTAPQESTKESIIQFETNSPEKCKELIVCEEAPKEDETDIQSEGDYIQVCEAPNENTPCEDTPDENSPNENEAAVVKVGIEANGPENTISMVVNGLLNQPIHITTNFATEMSVKAVEKRFGRQVAEAFRAALKYMKKPGQWFIKVIKKKNRKSIKSN